MAERIGKRNEAVILGLRLACGALLLLPACSQVSSPYRPEEFPGLPVRASENREAARFPKSEPIIRVLMLRDVPEARWRAPAGGAAVNDSGGRELFRLPGNQELAVTAANSAWRLNGLALPGGPVRMVCLVPGEELRLGAAEVAPVIVLHRESSGRISAVAHLPLEEYLAGVLAGEVPYDRWRPEALKAQAVASRSFALFQVRAREKERYDVECTVMSQVFRPGFRKEPRLARVLSETRGLVVTSGGELVPAYFHSTCGGRTAAVERVFPERPANKVLRGVKCPFCTQSPAYQWSAILAKEELERRLAASPEASGRKLGAITGLAALGREGRAEQVRITHSLGTWTLNANRFRLLAGAKELKSVQIEEMSIGDHQVQVRGRGFGHGVGLCQYGAEGMAAQGYVFEQILGFYFPGGELTRLYGAQDVAGR